MSNESEGLLKIWIRDFAKKEGRKPRAIDMPDKISKQLELKQSSIDLSARTVHLPF